MKKLLFAVIISLAANSYADQKYNGFTGKFETTSPDATLEYNGFTGQHQYVPRPAGVAPRLEYNGYENTFEFAPVTNAEPNPLSPPSAPKAPSAPRL